MQPLSFEDFRRLLKPRPKTAHKGDFGHVLVIGGDEGFAGAGRMASEAALRVGAGLVSLATHPAHAHAITAERPEIMGHAVETPDQLAPLLAKATVVVLGPGLGQRPWGQALWQMAIGAELPKVIDADGLNFLAKQPLKQDNWVLTPHPGEAARLLQTTADAVEKDREQSVQALQQQYGGVAVLKGAGTLIADGKGTGMCQHGNPGMASGGMGDVLAGIIGGFLAQGLAPIDAAKLGVTLHSYAADQVAKTGERGLLATDVINSLRALVNPHE